MPGLFTELRERKVYRTAAIYAGAAFVVWQVADIALPALGAPEWVMRVIVLGALIGFPIALVLAWLFDLAPGSARVFRFAAIGAVAVALLGGAAALVARVGLPEPAEDVSERTLAVLPFQVRGSVGLAYLRDGMVDLLSRNLGSADLHTVDAAAVVKAAEPLGTEVTLQDAAGVARRVGAGQFVVGTVNEIGGRVLIHATLYALRDSVEKLISGEVEGDTLQLFAMVDRLTADLLAGQSTGAASRRVVRTAATTTSSIEALKLYLEGERFFRVARHDSAIARFGEAIERDTTFTLARMRRAMSHVLLDEFRPAREEIIRLRGASARLSEHDRRVLEAFDAHAHGRVDDATELYRAVLREYPADVEAKVLLASLLTTYAPLRGEPMTEARELLAGVEALDPDFLCIACMQQVIAWQERDIDRVAELKLHLRAGLGKDTTQNPHAELIAALRNGRDLAAIDSVIARAAAYYDEPDLLIATANGMLLYALALGRFDVAERLIDVAMELDPPASLRIDRKWRFAIATGHQREAAGYVEQALSQGLLAPQELAYMALLNPAMEMPVLDRLRSELLDWRVDAASADSAPAFDSLTRLFWLGMTDARRGDLPAAARWVDSIAAPRRANGEFQRSIVAGMTSVLRADIAWRSGEPARALELLEPVDYQVPPDLLYGAGAYAVYAAELRGYASLDAGRFDDAVRWLRYSTIGSLPIASYAHWNLAMARALDGLGRREEAADHYALALAAWSDADPELASQVDYARRRLTDIRVE